MTAAAIKKTYQERNALAASSVPALKPVPAIPLTPFKPQFAALEAKTMGVLGTSRDGFDAVFKTMVAAVPGHAVQVAAMDKNISAATFKPGAIVSTVYQPIGSRIAALAKIGDQQLANYSDAVAGKNTSPAPAPPPPPAKPPKKPTPAPTNPTPPSEVDPQEPWTDPTGVGGGLGGNRGRFFVT